MQIESIFENLDLLVLENMVLCSASLNREFFHNLRSRNLKEYFRFDELEKNFKIVRQAQRIENIEILHKI